MKEKVKAYDEALERAESKESKDEKIRKTILSHFKSFKQWACGNGVNKEDCIAWLEKQGEHANFRNKIQIGDKVTRNEDGVLVNLSQLNRVAKK